MRPQQLNLISGFVLFGEGENAPTAYELDFRFFRHRSKTSTVKLSFFLFRSFELNHEVLEFY